MPSFHGLALHVHTLVLQAAEGRFDDVFRVNLGDLIVVPDDRIDAVVFGTKTDKAKHGMIITIPFSCCPGSAYCQLLGLLARALARLAALPQPLLSQLVDAFLLTVGSQPIPETIYSFPAGCLEPLLSIQSSQGTALPAHSLPLFGAWLSSDVLSVSSSLAARDP